MRSTVLKISPRILTDNARAVREYLPKNVRFMAVVKADAYGHGCALAARAFLDGGADCLAVAIPEEASLLRGAGISAPILVLGGGDAGSIEEAVLADAAQAVYTPDMVADMQTAAEKTGRRARAHLKIDTGMSRLGVRGMGELTAMLGAFRRCPLVDMEGIFTHFADPESDPEFTERQDREFRRCIDAVRAQCFAPRAHAAATSAFENPRYMHDMVRPGLALYGFGSEKIPLTPAQELTARPVRLEIIRPGDTVSYGRTFAAARDTLVMTVPIGYGDGYPRALGGKGRALVDGVSAPIIGRVCMDMLMLDVTRVPGASVNSEVVLIGRRGSEEITALELADITGTIPYEIMLGFLPRVRREVMG